MKYKFAELVDIPALKNLMEGLYLVSGIPSGILEPDGNILIEVGWRDICLKFHFANPETKIKCEQSNNFYKRYMREDSGKIKPFICYTCPNGLIDAVTPIIIDGEYIAGIFQGQFLFEEPDVEQFRQRAKRYGFDEKEYLEALAKVPIFTKEKLNSTMYFFGELGKMLTQMGLTKLQLIKSQERAIQASEERLKTIINNAPNVAIESYDEHGKLRFVNKASEFIFGWKNDEVIGKTLDQLIFTKDFANEVSKRLKLMSLTGEPMKDVEWLFKNKDGIEKCMCSTLFSVISDEGKKEFIIMDLDITEKKRFEKEMHRLEQLNLVGQMAAGIGHEVRNPMTTVRGLLQLLNIRNQSNEDVELFELMIQELDRANSIITEFLALAKNKIISLEIKNLNSVISIMAPLIESMVREADLDLNLDLGEIPELLFDEKEIRQLILNFTKNGIEAMSSRGCLTIRTYKQNDRVILEVEDEGEGISSEILDQIGVPFFTTKENGTGLGLATCYSIAARQNAKISVESTRGKTIFSVHFKFPEANGYV